MSEAGNPAADLVNKGFIVNRPGADRPGRTGRTFIVTGLYRSGTSLVASVLREVGIFMGSEINDIVHEDEECAKIIMARDSAGLRWLIEQRNAAYGTWGFKLPMLSRWLDPADLARFNDPHVIVTFRDPVAVSVRTSLSEYQDARHALGNAVEDLAAIVTFAARLGCPTLLLSYEKALVLPGDFVDAITRFCGLPQNEALRGRLAGLIEPNRQSYIAGARRRYEGIIEGVAGGCLYGWCRLTGVADPVTLDLFVDDRAVLTFVADEFRQDLLDAGYANGTHGFRLDLRRLGVQPQSIVRIKVSSHAIELDNSGRRLAELGQRSGTNSA